MRELLNAMRTQAGLVAGGKPVTRFGTISAYDPDRYAVRVLLDPEDPATETGWIPLASHAIGDGWGLFAGPSLGDQVEIRFQEGSPEAPYVNGRFYSDVDRPTPEIGGEPAGCPSGEIWMVHKSGSRLRFLGNGDVELHVAGNLALAVGGDIASSAANWAHTGDISVEGAITASVDVVADGISLHDHDHEEGVGKPT